MNERVEWFRVDASSARFFRLGEAVRAGQILGECPDGWGHVTALEDGKVVQIQYDIDSNHIILAVVPSPLALTAA